MIRALRIKNGIYNRARIRVKGHEIGTTTPIYAIIHKKSEVIDYHRLAGFVVSQNKTFSPLPGLFVDVVAGLSAPTVAKFVQSENRRQAERSTHAAHAARALAHRRRLVSLKARRYCAHEFTEPRGSQTRARAYRTALDANAAELGRVLVTTPPAERKRTAQRSRPRRHADIC
jgi:hypothetical protein